MGRPLRALVVEDVEADAVLLLRELRRGGFDVTFRRVDTPEDMAAALDGESWDVVIADYVMPRFGASQALAMTKERALDLPFIIVSGTVNEEMAVEVMRAGANDFMAKGNFARLIPAIEREMREVEARNERTRMREQLLISDRMASIGTLAAGVAHEINNPLGALMANLDFATQDVARLVDDARVHARALGHADDAMCAWLAARVRAIDGPLREARDAAERVRLIVRDLKIFSRSEDDVHGPVDVRPVVESSLRMAWNEIRHRARLVRDFHDVPAVHGNEARFGQVFLNLFVNAAQAIPEGRADQNEIRVRIVPSGPGHVAVEVIDTGTGISNAVLARMFDPFFTTKPVGEGTGLGLAICHRIVTSQGGRIEVETEVGRGSLFRVILPVSVCEPVAIAAREPVASARRARILVVDDEVVLGGAIHRMLSTQHEVVTLRSAKEALDRIVAGERFDIVLCDLMMPDVSGMELHALLVACAPEQADRMVFMTGGAFTARARDFLRQAPNPRIEKPFDGSDLRSLLNGLLR